MRATALSSAFAAAVLGDRDASWASAPTGSLAGIEHEYRVWHNGALVDFTTLIGRLDLGRRHLDPADANAFRLASGAALTCDERDAEIALPPLAVRSGVTRLAAAFASAERRDLQQRLGDALPTRGYSTHISVSVDASAHDIDAAAVLYARTFAVPMMLLLDCRSSFGIYVRPRPGRLELCGEFALGERLRAALAFAIGSVRACVSAVAGGALLPPQLRLRVEPAVGRYGYLVTRHAIGGDLYASGRATLLRCTSGDVTTAQEQLLHAWTCAHDAVQGLLDAGDLDAAERRVQDTGLSLPVDADADEWPAGPDADATPPVMADDLASAFGRMLGPFHRNGFDMAPVMLTWDAAVLVAARLPDPRTAFVCVPRAAMPPFLAALDRGVLDDLLVAYLDAQPSGDWLTHYTQTARPGLYASMGGRRQLLWPEPNGGAP